MAKRTNIKGGARGRTQTFSFHAPDAASVQLVGDFTRWQDSPINLNRGTDGVWRARVQLPAGTQITGSSWTASGVTTRSARCASPIPSAAKTWCAKWLEGLRSTRRADVVESAA